MTTLQAPIRPHDPVSARTYEPEARSVGGPLVNTAAAVLTVGLLPALWWPIRWDRDVASDRLAWLRRIERLRERSPEDTELRHLADRLRPRHAVEALAWLAGVVALIAVVAISAQVPSYHWVVDFLFHRADHSTRSGRGYVEEARRAWFYALLISYGLSWYAIRSHAVTVCDLVKHLNRGRKKAGLSKIRNVATHTSVGWLWVVATVALCFHDAWWSIPMVMAAGLQRRYLGASGNFLRAEVDGYLNSTPRPVVDEEQSSAVRYCSTHGCGRRLADGARFCPRCGTATPVPRGVYSIL